MDNNSKQTEQRQLPNGEAVFVPDDIYHSFQNIFEMMKEAQRELHKVRDEMKPVEELKMENL